MEKEWREQKIQELLQVWHKSRVRLVHSRTLGSEQHASPVDMPDPYARLIGPPNSRHSDALALMSRHH